MIVAILLITLIMCMILTVVGIVFVVALKLQGYEAKEMEKCWEEKTE